MRIFRGDLEPDLEITCLDGSTPVDLTTATSVRVIGVMDGEEVFDRAPTSATVAGVVTMQWQAADTDTTGTMLVEVEVTWPGSRKQTFRPETAVRIDADLG